MILKAIVVDDEKLARSRLKRLLSEFESIEIVGEAQNGVEALDVLGRTNPDLIFLDIRMPLMDGFELLNHVKKPPMIIFTTAYNQHALQAFEASAIDYLLKPIAPEKLQRAIAKVEKMGRAGTDQAALDQVISMIRTQEQRLRRFSSRSGDRVHMISESEVNYFRAEDKYTFLHAHKEHYIVSYTLKDLEQRLDPDRFLRVHRSAIVNLDRIDKIEKWFGGKWKLTFANGETVMVSAGLAPAFKDKIGL